MTTRQCTNRKASSARHGAAMTPARRKQFDFMLAVTERMRSIGAREQGPYGWQIDTVCGVLDIRPHDAWVACRFDDVERANAGMPPGQLNPYSGKWNWHFVRPTAADVEFFIEQLRRIQRVPGKEA